MKRLLFQYQEEYRSSIWKNLHMISLRVYISSDAIDTKRNDIMDAIQMQWDTLIPASKLRLAIKVVEKTADLNLNGFITFVLSKQRGDILPDKLIQLLEEWQKPAFNYPSVINLGTTNDVISTNLKKNQSSIKYITNIERPYLCI